MKDGQLFRVKVINSEEDNPKEYGVYLTEFGWLRYNGRWEYEKRDNVTYTRGISWYLIPEPEITDEDIERECPAYCGLSGEHDAWIAGAKAIRDGEIKHIEKRQ